MRPNFTAICQTSTKANFTHLSATKCGFPTTNATETFYNSAHSAVTKATLIEIANDVQQHEVYLSAHENKLMAQFQEMLSLLQNSNAAHMHLLANSIETKEKMQENNNRSLVSTVGFMGAAHTLELSATTRPTTTRTNLPSTTFW